MMNNMNFMQYTTDYISGGNVIKKSSRKIVKNTRRYN